MHILSYLLLPLCSVLGTLQMDKDLQYNCYYQMLKKYSTKSSYDYDENSDYNSVIDTLQLNMKPTQSVSIVGRPNRMRREFYGSDDNRNQDEDHQHRKIFSSAYAEPRNSGHYKQGTGPPTPLISIIPNKTIAIENSSATKEVTYFIVASKTLRPGILYKVSASVVQAQHSIKIFANISCDSIQLSGDSKDVEVGASETLLLYVPPNALQKRSCKLRLEGFFLNVYCDLALLHEYDLDYVQHSRIILIQTDKPLYMQGDKIRFRVTVTSADFKPDNCVVEIFIIDPHQHITWRWLKQLPISGTIALDYKLTDQPVFGEWTIKVVTAEQGEQQKSFYFSVEEFHRNRLEVEVKIPTVLFTTSTFIKGSIAATTTSYEAVKGKLTIFATLYPLGYLDAKSINLQHRLRLLSNASQTKFLTEPYSHTQELMRRSSHILHVHKKPFSKIHKLSQPGQRLIQQTVPQFNGSFNIKWAMFEGVKNNLAAFELLVSATVAAADIESETYSGYAITRIYQPNIRVVFLGDSIQVFKPSLPFNVFIAVEYINGSPLDSSLLSDGLMYVTGTIQTQFGGAKLNWPNQNLQMLRHRAGIWELKIDLRNDMPHTARDFLNGITQMRLNASFTGVTAASAQLLLIAHQSPRNRFIKVTTSTEQPTIGEFIIFEINTNFYVEHFNYLLLSKGVILMSEQETFKDGMRTIALVLSAEMAPVAEFVVWAITWQGDIVTDSITFPVTGIFRHNFTVKIKNTDQMNEVSVYGAPGAFISLSSIARELYDLQNSASSMNYAALVDEMTLLYNKSNIINKHVWHTNKSPSAFDELDTIYYPASTFGIDANRTFNQSGFIVVTDGFVPRNSKLCNQTIDFVQCLTGSCFRLAKKCDGYIDCLDGSDEIGCNQMLSYNLLNDDFNKYRINRIYRHYHASIWFWQNIQLDSNGRASFQVDEPPAGQTSWMISGFSTSHSSGIGLINKVLSYVSKRPFEVFTYMPKRCRIYESIGIRISIMKYIKLPVLATVKLQNSQEFIFVANSSSQSPEEREFTVTLSTLQHRQSVFVPFMPIFLGNNTIIVHVSTIYGDITTTWHLNVEKSDLVQRHQTVYLNLTEEHNSLVSYVNISDATPQKRARITLIGSVVGALFDTTFVYSAVSSTLELAEEFAFAFAANLYSVMYLRMIASSDKHNMTHEKEIYYNMNRNYQRLLSFMRPDGSFSNFQHELDSSVWLTAHCLRLFQKASAYKMNDYIWIDASILEKNLNWLLEQQTSEGAWLQTNIDGVLENNITLTAYVLTTLGILQNNTSSNEMRVEMAKTNALNWLERNLYQLQSHKQPYDVAVVTYALLLCKSPLAEITLPMLHELARHSTEMDLYWADLELNNSHWSSSARQTESASIETTAYALLSYLLRSDSNSDSIVNWLNKKCLREDGWISTRAKNVALYALITNTANSRRRKKTAITVELMANSSEGGMIKRSLSTSNFGSAQLQSIELLNIFGTLKITSNGLGYAVLKVHIDDNADSVIQQPVVPAFRLTNNVLFHGIQGSQISYTTCINWINTQQSACSGLTVLDVTLPTGYGIHQRSLDAYVLSNQVKHLIRATFMETKIVFFFSGLNVKENCLNFTIKRWYPVANMTRFLPIRVYDYHSPEHFASELYDSSSAHLLNNADLCSSFNCTNGSASTTLWHFTNLNLLYIRLIFICFISLLQTHIISCLNI